MAFDIQQMAMPMPFIHCLSFARSFIYSTHVVPYVCTALRRPLYMVLLWQSTYHQTSTLPHTLVHSFVTSVQLDKSTSNNLHAQSHDLTHLWSFHQCSLSTFCHATTAHKRQVNPTGHVQQSHNTVWGLPAVPYGNPPVPLCFSGDTEDPGASRFLRLPL